MTSERTKKDIRPLVFFKNYDYTTDQPDETSPGGGLFMNQEKYKSTGDFLKKQSEKRKNIMKKVKACIVQHNDMTLVRQANDLDGVDVFPENLHEMMDKNHLLAPSDDNVIFEDEELTDGKHHSKDDVDVHKKHYSDDFVLDLDGDEPSFTFVLDKVPGGDDQDDIEIADEIEVDEPEEKVEVQSDPWGWKVGPGFYDWLEERKASIPRHTGKDLAGVLRAISYLERFSKEVHSAARSDINDQLNIKVVENVMEELHKGIEALKDRRDLLEKQKFSPRGKKKRSDDGSNDFVKVAQKIPGINGIYVSVPLLISSLARSCINGMVSAGKDIERVYADLTKEYSLSKREKLELLQCLADSGYPLRRDLGVPLDQEIDTRSVDNVNWAANYPG